MIYLLHPLTLVTFLPLVGVLVLLFLRAEQKNLARWVALLTSLATFAIAIAVLVQFKPSNPDLQMAVDLPWIQVGTWDIHFHLAVDGLSILLLLLTSFLTPISILSTWSAVQDRVKDFMIFFLLLEVGMNVVFLAQDLFLFYVFWEFTLVPMYFLIGIWGGPRREYAAIKFFLYTLLGSVLILLAMIALYFSVTVPDPATGERIYTFNMLAMMNPSNFQAGSLLAGVATYGRHLAYIALFIGFAIKVPIFPFHTWLPDAHVEAPTAISVILAGVLLKMGTYGLLRVSYPIFPDLATYYAWPLAIVALINIVYGALCAMAQQDFKKLIAYSSISHMGIVLLGMSAMNTQGMLGAVFQMFNHGTITAMLFLIVGVIYDRAHTRDLDSFGGLAITMPKYTGIMTVAFFAALGLPGLSGFVSEAFSFLGAFQTFRVITIISTLGIVLTAGYMLWTLQRVFLGQPNERWASLPDINGRELFTLVPLAVIVIALGIYPSIMLDLMTSSLNHLVEFVKQGGAAVAMLP
jgi:NADH-quinone oxidoreductase subunit M